MNNIPQKLRIGILEVGQPPEPLGDTFGSYVDMVAAWLTPFDAEIKPVAVMDGEKLPPVQEADLWVITGSRCAVYENHPWIAPLINFIQNVAQQNKKLIGICFGHQIMAVAFGGTVEKSDKGWGLGVTTYSATKWPSVLQQPFDLSLIAYHQDQVITPPSVAITAASTQFCPHAMLHYPGLGFSFQAHPEFGAPYVHQLLELRRNKPLSSLLVDQALPTLVQPINAEKIARRLAECWPDF